MLRSAGPCEAWSPIWCVNLPLSTAAVSGDALMAATEVLWAKSGRQFDECIFTIRPCRKECFDIPWWDDMHSYPQPYQYAGQWYNLGCGGCPGTCSCTILHSVELPGPVATIIEVKVDGTPLVTGSYVVYDGHLLLRTDGVQDRKSVV